MTVRRIALTPMLLLTLTSGLLGGCGGATTETGYQPKRLGMNGSEVRSLYAPAFSPDSHPAQDNATGSYGRHPGM